jgi:peptidoglycan/LPS O-acetylase OafA/YrhL
MFAAGPAPLTVSLVVAIAVIPLAAFSFYFFETPARRLISGNRNQSAIPWPGF